MSDWERFTQDHKVDGGLKIVPAKQFGVARRSTPEEGSTALQLGQKYLFELTSPKPCHVVAFECFNDTWHPLGLGQEERVLRVKVPLGTSLLPRATDGTPIPLAEYDHPGLHRFVFVLSFGPKPPSNRKALIALAEHQQVEVVEVEVRFVG